MPVPLALSIPLAAGALAYLNGKGGLGQDMKILKLAISIPRKLESLEKQDRLNAFNVLEEHANNPEIANKDLLLFEDKRFTYRQVYDTVLRYANWMRAEFDIKPEEIVAMNFENCHQFIFVWMALWSLGAKPAFINYNLTGNSLAHCLRISKTRLCISQDHLAQNVDAILKDTPGITAVQLTPALQQEISTKPAIPIPASVRGGQKLRDLAVLIFTSGTTGLPKAAIMSWDKCLGLTVAGASTQGQVGGPVMYSPMPLYHGVGAFSGFCAPMVGGRTLALGKKFSASRFWDEVRQHNATSITHTGEVMRYVVAAPPKFDPVTGENLDKKHNVQAIFGNGLGADLWAKIRERFGIDVIMEFYSSTEGNLTLYNRSYNKLREGAIGRLGWLLQLLTMNAFHLVEVDWDTEEPWRDPETGFCKKVKYGEPGEALSLLPEEDIKSKFQGYYNNTEATDKKILRNVFKKGDAYFRTGDILRWGGDDSIYFVDRIGDTFRWKSENVATTEVTMAMGAHPSVVEANVYGVKLPGYDGQAGCAAVVFNSPVPSADDLHSLATHLHKALPKYAVPVFLRVHKEAQAVSTGNGKLQKQSLRDAGVKPGKVAGLPDAEMYWLKGGTYVPFSIAGWNELQGGKVKL